MTIPMQMKVALTIMLVLDFMMRKGLTLVDLIAAGGEDLKSANPTVKKAKRVEKTWALMARLSVRYVDLEKAAGNSPIELSRGARGEGSEVIENIEVSTNTPHEVKSLKTNNKTDNHSVEASEKGRWKRKRRLVSGGAA